MAEGVAARAAAVALLGAVLGEGRMLREVAADDGPLAALPPPDRARARRLAALVLRHLEPADRVLAPLLRKAPPAEVRHALRHALRLAVVEMAVGGAAAHGAVNAAVEIVRRGNRTGHLAGLANAVLRKVAEMPAPFAALPPQRMPQWLRQPLVHAWGREAVSAMEAIQAAEPPLDLTPRAEGVVVPGAELLPTGSLRIAAHVQVSTLDGYAEGRWWVQDAGAALAARVLAPAPGENVVDLCAAPGGKTMQMAAMGARVTAVDISGPRLARLRANLTRTGLAAEVITADALHWEPPGPVDAVLLDAPCSATGTIRRHPDLPFVKNADDLPALIALQAALIDRALGFLRPGGRLVYCVCSLLPEEGEGQLAAALIRHSGLAPVAPIVPGLDDRWRCAPGALRLRPDHWAEVGGIDGFFIASLRKA